MRLLEKLWFKLKTGTSIEVINNGEPTEEYIIRFKDKYISLLVSDSGDIHSLGWSDDGAMFNVPLREHWVAKPPKGKKV